MCTRRLGLGVLLWGGEGLTLVLFLLTVTHLGTPSAQPDGPSAYETYGFDRLLYSWDSDSLNGLTCFNPFQPDPRQGFFCDASQLATGINKDAYTYQRLVERVFSDPPADVARLVAQSQGTTVGVQDLYSFTKEQMDLGKGNPQSSITAYFLQRSRGEQDRDLPLAMEVVHAPAKEPSATPDPTGCAELQDRYVLGNLGFQLLIGFLDVYDDFDQQIDFPDAQALFQRHPEVYERVAACWNLPSKEDVPPEKNFVVFLLTYILKTTGEETFSYQNPGSIPVDGSDPLLDPEVVPLEEYGLTAERTRETGTFQTYGYAISLEAFLRHPPFRPQESLMYRLKKELK